MRAYLSGGGLKTWNPSFLRGSNPLLLREKLGVFVFCFLFFLFIYLFIYFWLCWVFVSVRGLSLVVASGGNSSSWCTGLSLSRPLLLWSMGSRRTGSVVVAHGPSCSAACGIFPDQGSNPCPLHWQEDSQPLYHQGSPSLEFLIPSHLWVAAPGVEFMAELYLSLFYLL